MDLMFVDRETGDQKIIVQDILAYDMDDADVQKIVIRKVQSACEDVKWEAVGMLVATGIDKVCSLFSRKRGK